MITEPTYNKPSFSCHQSWINIYYSFKTKRECVNKRVELQRKYPETIAISKISERTIWINSVIDTGRKYYDLLITISVHDLGKILKI